MVAYPPPPIKTAVLVWAFTSRRGAPEIERWL